MKHPLIAAFEAAADPAAAIPMRAYMKEKAEFYGIKAQPRREIFKNWLAQHGLPDYPTTLALVEDWFGQPYRDLHYCAIELLGKHKKSWTTDLLPTLEWLATTHSWWDSVDLLEAEVIGPFFRKFPQLAAETTEKWTQQPNIWLQRLSITYQLHYKKATDTDLLFRNIRALTHSKEFFVQKAIGWALRQYGRTAPDLVREFVAATTLPALSRREAMKHL